ncbi:RNA binding protein fox-1 homolog 1-like [Xyrichtys novacula]|uniref:RNA binding protein fox-1 homolog 1-like n=1 Tax=Xyrichtys novacula TaxID=13765 RepID=A0AAV1GRY6_XYRNO|nr:RNA binding protein fox-1 homolog 1-like [Xyrichtys novacula]
MQQICAESSSGRNTDNHSVSGHLMSSEQEQLRVSLETSVHVHALFRANTLFLVQV